MPSQRKLRFLRPRRLARQAATGVWLAVALGVTGWAEPYVPRSDDEVLERLPPGLRSSDLRRQREELAADPENLRDSVAMARSYLDIARLEGDPRYLGHAQAILGPWWERPSPPAPVLALRGMIRNASWEYDRALADLEPALAAAPTNRMAQLARLEALLARADYGPARSAVEAIVGGPGWPPLVQAGARARLDRVTGRARDAEAALRSALAEAGEKDPGEEHDARLLLADLAGQLGRPEEAREQFAHLTRLGRRDVQRLAAEADFHLADGKPRAALDLLASETALDSLAERVIEALGALPGRTADEEALRTTLTERLGRNFEARRRRGDVTGLPDEIRFRLRAVPDPSQAVARSRDLWAVRRDLGDARLILEAANSGRDAKLAEPVIAWLQANGIDDVRCRPWLPGTGPEVRAGGAR